MSTLVILCPVNHYTTHCRSHKHKQMLSFLLLTRRAQHSALLCTSARRHTVPLRSPEMLNTGLKDQQRAWGGWGLCYSWGNVPSVAQSTETALYVHAYRLVTNNAGWL